MHQLAFGQFLIFFFLFVRIIISPEYWVVGTIFVQFLKNLPFLLVLLPSLSILILFMVFARYDVELSWLRADVLKVIAFWHPQVPVPIVKLRQGLVIYRVVCIS